MGAIGLLFLKGIAWGYWLLPQPAKKVLQALVGRALLQIGVRRQVAEQNLLLAFPGDSQEVAAKRRKILRESYEQLSALGFEILMLLGPMPRFVRKRSVLRGIEHWEAACASGKGVVFFSSHLGNWEVMVAAGAYWAGMDTLIVTKHLKPEWLHRAIEKGRMRCGMRATYEPKTMRDILTQLKQGGTIGIVLDQYAGPPVGVRVPFFGVTVSTTTALAMLVRRTGVTVLPVANYRDAEGRFIVEIRPPMPWIEHSDANYELAANTAAYVAHLEQEIRRHPEQWLWIHRRFKGDLSPLRPGEWLEGRARK